MAQDSHKSIDVGSAVTQTPLRQSPVTAFPGGVCSLPEEILIERILSSLPSPVLGRSLTVSRLWLKLSREEYVWKTAWHRDFGSGDPWNSGGMSLEGGNSWYGLYKSCAGWRLQSSPERTVRTFQPCPKVTWHQATWRILNLES